MGSSVQLVSEYTVTCSLQLAISTASQVHGAHDRPSS
jgi:hypothetical protein